ncbi:hypothetical protein ACFQ8C_28920 [Streptomyces sp. NPDC056503]|uniref:hypothetical protein n=1 Tax=Streptomyces sp. NPDC056503 TaxID=3345842 RepID=UPI0036C1F4E4
MGSIRRRLGRLRRAAGRRAAVRRALAPLRGRLLSGVFLPLRGKRSARLLYAAVLDGQTMNLHAELPASARSAEEAVLLLGRGRTLHESPARVHRDRSGRLLADAAVLLGAEAGGVPVPTGTTRLRLRVGAGRGRRSYPLLLVESPHTYQGTTRPMTASPISGDRYRVGRSFAGSARLRRSPAVPGAEVVDVHIQHARIDVSVRLVGLEAGEPWCEFVASGRRIPVGLTETGPGVWQAEVPLAEMYPVSDRREHWDVLLHTGERRPHRVARLLHDLSDPQRVLAMREVVVAPQKDSLMSVEPRYTPAGNLRFTCRRVDETA